MKSLLFIVPLKTDMLVSYKAFIAEITGARKREYSDLLKRYGLRTAKVWHQKVENKEYIMIFHLAEDNALERLKTWASSTDPFDLWFKEHLNKCYEGAPELANFLFEFDSSTIV